MVTKTYAGVTYSNGRVPASLLAELNPKGKHGNSGTAHAYLRKDAAASWNRAVAEVKASTGLDLRVRGWNRTWEEQVKFFLERFVTYDTGRKRRTYNGRSYWLKPGVASAAQPGYSNHGWGLAVDVIDFGNVGEFGNARRRKALPILVRHGWTDTEGRKPDVNEPWHLVYNPATDKHDTPTKTKDWLTMATKQDVKDAVLEVLKSAEGRKAIANGTWNTDGVLTAPEGDAAKKNPHWTARGWLGSIRTQAMKR